MDSTAVVPISVSVPILQIDWQLWIQYLGCAVLGGLAQSLINQKGALVLPQRGEENGRKAIVLGPISDMVVGIVAAIGIFWVVNPQTYAHLLAVGAIAGYGGGAILRSLANRILLDAAAKETEKKERRLQDLRHEAEMLEKDKEALQRADRDRKQLLAIKQIGDLIVESVSGSKKGG